MKTVNAQQAHALITADDAILIDVRTPAEFEQSHIAAAMSLPLNMLDDSFDKLSLTEGKTIILQCQKGLRGQQAQALLANKTQRSEQFINLEGGIEAWQQAGLPVISNADAPSSNSIPMPRQVQITSGAMVLLFSLLSVTGNSWASYVLIVMGAMMIFSGASGWCGMVQLLLKMPWNK